MKKIIFLFTLAYCFSNCSNVKLGEIKTNPPYYYKMKDKDKTAFSEQIILLKKQYDEDYEIICEHKMDNIDISKKLFENYDNLILLLEKRHNQGLINILDEDRYILLKNNIIKYKKEINKLIDKKVM